MPAAEALKLGSSALLSYRAAIETTGHNIANISTPGYSRQRVDFSSARPSRYEFGAVGRGVEVKGVERIVDDFLDGQLRLAAADAKRWKVLEQTFSSIESFINEPGEGNLGDALSRFFAALQDIASGVENLPLRSQAVQQARALRDVFVNLRQRLTELRRRLDLQVPQMADKVNRLTAEIADLNHRISEAEAGGTGRLKANDLRDQRGQKLRELSEIIGVNVREDPHGGVVATVGGKPLVYFDHAIQVKAEKGSENGVPVNRLVFSDGTTLEPDSGALKGLFDARDETVANYISWLDDFAASIIYRVNKVHSVGVGLEPFSKLTGTNRVADASAALSRLDLPFEPRNGVFQVGRGDLIVQVTEKSSGATSSHRISIDPSMPLSGQPGALVERLDAVQGISARVDALGRVVLEAEDGYGFFFSEDSAGVLPVLGLAGLFAGYDAGTIDVNPDIDGRPELFAGARSLTAGDNSNASALSDLQETGTFLDTELSLEEAYQAMIGRLGSDTEAASDASRNQHDVLLALENERQDISGVNLDEEMANLIQYQRAYQGVAKFISVVDKLLETLMEM